MCSSLLTDRFGWQWEALGAWFLGPHAENGEVLQELVQRAVAGHCEFRRGMFVQDKIHITDKVKQSHAYRSEVDQLREELATILTDLRKTVPFFSTRFHVRTFCQPRRHFLRRWRHTYDM